MVDTVRYKACLRQLMSFKDGVIYPDDREFTPEELQALTPDDIYRYFKLRAYGNADADEDEENPTEARSSAVLFWKKALSYFMPNNAMPWNEIENVGNPTKSSMINSLIHKIKSKEAARLGRESQARRALFVDGEKFNFFAHKLCIYEGNRMKLSYSLQEEMTDMNNYI